MSAATGTTTPTTPVKEVVHVTKDAAMRILSDVREIMRFPLHGDGIYYVHDDEDILTGYAMLYGQPGTLYYGGYYFFKVTFPPDYPHKPPKVKFLSNDGTTRMHPNFYKNGYVCLSILGNWRGDQWTGCVTLKSILLTMISIMDAKPMLHEPGLTLEHSDCEPYHRIIEYKNIEFALGKLLDEREFGKYIILPDTTRKHYTEVMRSLFIKNRDEIVKYVNDITTRASSNSINVTMSRYGMTVTLYYDTLKEKINISF